MSLVKTPKLTPRKLAALRANARHSRGPATPEGRERVRAALSSDGGLQPRSPFERDALLAPDHPHTALMLRMENSSFRQVWRLTDLLMKIKRSGGCIPQGEANGEVNSPPPSGQRAD